MSHRTALPQLPGLLSGLPPGLPGLPSGLPWWGAILLAVTSTAVGFAYDAGAGNKELGAVFATFYVLGCLAAVLLVRRAGLFTAVIQPPLILFVAVPTAYFLFHSGEISGIKDILINCGYPLIERFPLMFFTSAVVLLIGMARWYFDRGPQRAHDATDEPPAKTPRRAARRFAGSAGLADDDEPARPPRRTRPTADPAERPRRAPRTGEPSRARHNRPPESDIAASAAAADRRERAAARERSGRPRRQGEPQLSGDPARQRRPRPPHEPRRTPRGGYEPYDAPYDAPDPYARPRRRPRPDDPYADPYPERPRRTAPDSSHHPVSRVRYRSSDDERPSRARPEWDSDY